MRQLTVLHLDITWKQVLTIPMRKGRGQVQAAMPPMQKIAVGREVVTPMRRGIAQWQALNIPMRKVIPQKQAIMLHMYLGNTIK